MGVFIAQAIRFLMVGGINVAIDFAVFNLYGKREGVSTVRKNLVSTAIAMSFSFFANSIFVFPLAPDGKGAVAIRFLIASCFSAFLVQTFVLVVLNRWRLLGSLVGESRLATKSALVNVQKGIACVAGMTSNFILYKLWVFA